MRMWLGPLPYYFCRMTITFKMVIINMLIFILTAIVITKFMFICIWKNMRSINDTLVTRIVIRCCLVIAMVFCLIRAIVQEKQSFLMVSGKTVTENWDSKLPSVETIFSYLESTAQIIFFLGIKISFFKHLFEKEFRETSQNFNSIRPLEIKII